MRCNKRQQTRTNWVYGQTARAIDKRCYSGRLLVTASALWGSRIQLQLGAYCILFHGRNLCANQLAVFILICVEHLWTLQCPVQMEESTDSTFRYWITWLFSCTNAVLLYLNISLLFHFLFFSPLYFGCKFEHAALVLNYFKVFFF